MAKLISKTYGDALLELAVEEEKTDLFFEEIGELMEVLKQNPDFAKLMNHPRIPVGKKHRLSRMYTQAESVKNLSVFLL